MFHFLVKVKNPIPPTRQPTHWPTRWPTVSRQSADFRPTRWPLFNFITYDMHRRCIGGVSVAFWWLVWALWNFCNAKHTRVRGIRFLTFTHFFICACKHFTSSQSSHATEVWILIVFSSGKKVMEIDDNRPFYCYGGHSWWPLYQWKVCLLNPIQNFRDKNILLQELPHHLNVNATL